MTIENTSHPEMEELRERIDGLNQQVADLQRQRSRRPAWRGIALLAMGLLAGLATHAYTQPPPQTLVCRELRVVDDNGKTIVYLGNNGKSADGKENGGYINVSTPEGHSSAKMYTFWDDTAYFSLYSKDKWVYTTVAGANGADMTIANGSEKSRTGLGVDPDGNGILQLWDKNNNLKSYP